MQHMQSDLIKQEILLSNQINPIAINAIKEMLDVTIHTFRKNNFPDCSFDDLIYAGILYLTVLHHSFLTPGKNSYSPSGIVLTAAEEAKKSCRRCLLDAFFVEPSSEPENDSNIRESLLIFAQCIYQLGLNKNNLLRESDEIAKQRIFKNLKPILTNYYADIIENAINKISSINQRDPSLSLFVMNEGHIGYIIGAAALLQQKTLNEIYPFH